MNEYIFTKSSVAVLLHTLFSLVGSIILSIYGGYVEWTICFLMYYSMTTLGSTVGYHRIATHNIVATNWLFKWICIFFGHIVTYGSIISWAAQHREHHRYTDTEKDPHSPKYKGWFYCHFLTPLGPKNPKYVVDMLRDPAYKFQHRYYWHLLLVWIAVLYVIDPFAVVYAWLAPSFIAKVCIGFSLSLSHRDNKPHNDFILGLVSGGECFHKSHHDDPKRIIWDKWDAGGQIIHLMKKSEGVG
jgi:stearoyl-CoA desaturase (delta-9 desaturase)